MTLCLINPKRRAVSSRSPFVFYILCIYLSYRVNITAVKYHGGRNYKIIPSDNTNDCRLILNTFVYSTTLPTQKQPTSSPIAFPRNSHRFPARCGIGRGWGCPQRCRKTGCSTPGLVATCATSAVCSSPAPVFGRSPIPTPDCRVMACPSGIMPGLPRLRS